MTLVENESNKLKTIYATELNKQGMGGGGKEVDFFACCPSLSIQFFFFILAPNQQMRR